jgi:preprotein translocase subunit SecB
MQGVALMTTDNTSNTEINNANNANAQQNGAPELKIMAQYVKDFSFESPCTPAIFRNPISAPAVEMNIGLAGAQQSDDGVFEVIMKATVHARDAEGKSVFMVETTYGSLVALRNIPEQMVGAALYIEAPRLMFPFVRRLIGDSVRDGGFPPLMPDMPDFALLYRQRLEQINQSIEAQQAAQQSSSENSSASSAA